MALRGGEERGEFNRPIPPVTLPALRLADLDIEAEAKEAAARVAERRIIRSGLDAWRAINKAESFDGWLTIGRALSIGKTHALKVTGNAAWGRSYSREFGLWMQQHGFASMPKSTRSVAVELHEHAAEITAYDHIPPGWVVAREPQDEPHAPNLNTEGSIRACGVRRCRSGNASGSFTCCCRSWPM